MLSIECIDPYNREIQWTAPMVVARCVGIVDGSQCTNIISRMHPYCQACTKVNLHVVVAPSSLGPHTGYGLFAYDPNAAAGDVIFESGEIIAPYSGHVISNKQLETMYGSSHGVVVSPYSLQISTTSTLDGVLFRGPAVYANDAAPVFDRSGKLIAYDEERCNSEFYIQKGKRADLVAVKDIRQYDEIFVPYAESYWEHPRNICNMIQS